MPCPTVVLRLLWLAPLAACGEDKVNCMELPSGQNRDWCWYEEAASLAAQGDAPGAVNACMKVDDSVVRAAAITKVLTESPSAFSQQEAMSLCATLIDSDRRLCESTWNRPHLWDR